jgi:hypothetical protein
LSDLAVGNECPAKSVRSARGINDDDREIKGRKRVDR